jgi:hypothetical protein
LLQEFQGLSDEVPQIEPLSLAVFDLVADARVIVAEDVENRQNLTVVWDHCLADHLSRKHQFLDYFEHGCDDLGVAGVEGG